MPGEEDFDQFKITTGSQIRFGEISKKSKRNGGKEKMLIATEKDCLCKIKIISSKDPEHCKNCKGYINYKVGM